MTTLRSVYDNAIQPAFDLLPARMRSPRAAFWMLAIQQQEDPTFRRIQVMPLSFRGEPPARGLWQFEQGGGVRGVLFHARTAETALQICVDRGIARPITVREVWLRLAEDDVLAAAFARLLLWSDAQPLPEENDIDAGWEMYCDRLWRPGRPHRDRWDESCRRAAEIMLSEAEP